MCIWQEPPERLALAGADIHLWRIALDLPAERLAGLFSSLSAEEQARAERYRFDDLRRRFIAAHGAVRAILGRYLSLSPALVQFQYNAYGKPALAGQAPLDVQFNLAHSGALALCAVAAGRPVGVDLEQVRPVEAVDGLVGQFFAPAEAAAFQRLPEAYKLPAFFVGWTRKEAYLKARGCGLSLPLDQFEVSLAPGAPPALLADRLHPNEVAQWGLRDLEVAPGYAAALAALGAGVAVSGWQW